MPILYSMGKEEDVEAYEKSEKKSPKRFTLSKKNVMMYVMAMSSAQT